VFFFSIKLIKGILPFISFIEKQNTQLIPQLMRSVILAGISSTTV